MTADGMAWIVLFPLSSALGAGKASAALVMAVVVGVQGGGVGQKDIGQPPAMEQQRIDYMACCMCMGHGEGAPVAVTRPKAH